MDKHHNSPIRRRRAAMGLTIRGLAAVAGISEGTIFGLEHGKNAASRASSEKLAAVFHCDAEALQAETDAYAKQERREKQKTRAKEQANRNALPACLTDRQTGHASLPVNLAVCLSVRQADRQAGQAGRAGHAAGARAEPDEEPEGAEGAGEAEHMDGAENRIDVQDGMVLDFPAGEQLKLH